MVHGKKVVIDYGRPDLKGRSLDELMKDLPEDRMWRTGENQATNIETAADLKIGGQSVPAGKYTLYVHVATDGDWALCVNKDLGVELGSFFAQAPPELAKELWPHLQGYDEKIGSEEVARIPMTKKSGGVGDVFSIELSGNALTLSWADQTWETSIE